MDILIPEMQDSFYERLAAYLEAHEPEVTISRVEVPAPEAFDGASLLLWPITGLNADFFAAIAGCGNRPDIVVTYKQFEQVEAAEQLLDHLTEADQLYAEYQSAAAMRQIINRKRCCIRALAEKP